jgi:hypothetical protein
VIEEEEEEPRRIVIGPFAREVNHIPQKCLGPNQGLPIRLVLAPSDHTISKT